MLVKTVMAALCHLLHQEHYGQILPPQIGVLIENAGAWCSRVSPIPQSGNHPQLGFQGLIPHCACPSPVCRVVLTACRLPWLRRRQMQVNWRSIILPILITITCIITVANHQQRRPMLPGHLYPLG